MKSIPKTEKTFDCVAFKREAAERIHEATRQMSPAEEVAHLNEAARHGPFGKFFRQRPGKGPGETSG